MDTSVLWCKCLHSFNEDTCLHSCHWAVDWMHPNCIQLVTYCKHDTWYRLTVCTSTEIDLRGFRLTYWRTWISCSKWSPAFQRSFQIIVQTVVCQFFHHLVNCSNNQHSQHSQKQILHTTGIFFLSNHNSK